MDADLGAVTGGRQFGEELLCLFGVSAVPRGYRRALTGQALADRRTDAPGTTCHERHARSVTLSRSAIAFALASRARICRVHRRAVGRADDALGRGVGGGTRAASRAGVGGVAQQLKRRPIVAGRAERDAPVRHRHVRVVLQCLQARALRLHEPERMNLRDALEEELARLVRGGRHRKVFGRAHARQELRRQERLRAGRRRAHVDARAGPAPVFWPRACRMRT